MEVITIENQAFSKLLSNIESLTKEIHDLNQRENLSVPQQKEKSSLKDEWIDNEEACLLFRVTKRTLQNYRDKSLLPYSQIRRKILYNISDLRKVFNDNYIKPETP
jgi:hypothetical protein